MIQSVAALVEWFRVAEQDRIRTNPASSIAKTLTAADDDHLFVSCFGTLLFSEPSFMFSASAGYPLKAP